MEGSQAFWSGAARPTKFVREQELAVTLLGGDVSLAGTGGLSVVNPTPGGGASNVLNLKETATPQNPAPTLTQLSPTAAAYRWS